MTVKPAALLAEFLGSMLLVAGTVGSMTMLTWVYDLPTGMALIGNALATGFILFGLIEVFGPISGAQFNPMVTAVMAVEEKTALKKALAYIAVQLLGGVVGILLVHFMFTDYIDYFVYVSTNVRGGGRYFSEVVSAFILMLFILILVVQKSAKLPLVIGLLVGGQILATSSTFFANPMVSFARMFTSVVSGIRPFDSLIFIAMQFIGGFLAYMIYKCFFKKELGVN